MAKGIKMDSGRKKSVGQVILKIHQISKEDNEDLVCTYCPAKIMYVSSYMRDSSNRKVSAYLKLWPDENHDEGCRNTVDGAVRQVIAESKSIEGNQPILEDQQDRSVIFRLNLLKDAQEVIKKAVNISSSSRDIGKEFIGTDYVKSGQKIESYFRSAVGVAKIRTLIQENDELEKFKKLVKIQYKGSIYNWNDFYYDSERYHVLANKLEKSRINHPISLIVTTKKILEYYENAPMYPWTIQCFGEQYNDKSKNRVIIPRIKTSIEKIADMFTVQSTYILVGDVWLQPVKDDIYRNINIAIHTRAQFQIDIG
jgi:hypothetical protein